MFKKHMTGMNVMNGLRLEDTLVSTTTMNPKETDDSHRGLILKSNRKAPRGVTALNMKMLKFDKSSPNIDPNVLGLKINKVSINKTPLSA